MDILFIGDIVGRPGRQILTQYLPELKKKTKVDLVVANGDNLAGGIGHTPETIKELVDAGVDLVTSGNHWTSKKESYESAGDSSLPIIRPANFPGDIPGKGYEILQIRTKKVLVINLIGQVFMNQFVNDPFREFDAILEKTKAENPDIILVDYHAEATAEKNAFGLYVDGRATAVLGTHTHVPTADASVMPKGTGYLTDVGMVGALHSVIGFNSEEIIKAHLNSTPFKLVVPEPEKVCINYALVHTADKTMTNESKLEKCGSILQKTEILKLEH